MVVIRNAVSSPNPGSMDPLKELETLMKQKNLTAIEAHRAQMLMRDHGTRLNGQILSPTKSVAKTVALTLDIFSTAPLEGDDQNTGKTLFCVDSSAQTNLALKNTIFDPYNNLDCKSPAAMHTVDEPLGAARPTTRSVFMSSLAASYPEAWRAPGVSTLMSDTRPAGPPPNVEILTPVRDSDGNYEGYVAVNGACMNALGVCIGYINDVECTAGSPKGEYLGCIAKPCHGEATIERPNGTQLAVLDLGQTILKTITGSTVAEFKKNGEVVANLGHRVCSFDTLSFHDQPTMALYLSFINPRLLIKAAHTQASTLQPWQHATTIVPKVPASVTFASTPLASANLHMPTSRDITAVCYDDIHTPSGTNRKSLADFASSEPWQLSAKIGDALALLETHDDGWATCIDINGCKGMFPLAYLEVPALASHVAEPRPSQAPKLLLARETTAIQSLLSKEDVQHSLRDMSMPPAKVAPYLASQIRDTCIVLIL